MKKIALFTNRFPSKVSTFFARDIYSLVEKGYQIDIFTVYPVQKKFWKFVPAEYREIFMKKVKVIYCSPINYFTPRKNKNINREIQVIIGEASKFGVSQTIKTIYVTMQAAGWAKKFDGCYDLLLSYWGNYAGTYSYLANRALKNKIPFSFFLHAGTDLYRDQIHLEQKILYADRVFTVCDFNQQFLKDLYPGSYELFKNKITIYNLGLDFENISFNLKNRDSKTLLTVGSFFPQKGFLYALQAFVHLAQDDKDLKLIMIGEGPEKKSFLTLIRKSGLEGRIIFTGWLPFEEVKRYLAKSTLLIHPSSDLGDAVPTVIKEAMASGLPVIGTDIVGIPELLDYGKCGMLVPSKDINALIAAIKLLLADPILRTKLAMDARKFAERSFSKKLGDVLTLNSLNK